MDKTDRYAAYLHGSSIGYTCYMYDLSHSLFAGVVTSSPGCTPYEIGLISCCGTMLTPGARPPEQLYHVPQRHYDVKSYVEAGMVDFVAVRAFDTTTSAAEPYKAVVSWGAI